MLRDYIRAALERAHYELIEDAEPFYGEVPGLKGVWAAGETLEGCRDNLKSTVEGWLLVRLSRNLSIPKIGGVTVVLPKQIEVAVSSLESESNFSLASYNAVTFEENRDSCHVCQANDKLKESCPPASQAQVAEYKS